MAKNAKAENGKRKAADVPAPNAVESLPDDFGDFGLDEATQIDPNPQASSLQPQASPEVRAVKLECVAYLLQGDVGEGHISRKATSVLTHKQAKIFYRLWTGLKQQHVQLDNGCHVDIPADAIKWLIERVGFAQESGQ